MQFAKSVVASLFASMVFYFVLTSLEIFGASTSLVLAFFAFLATLIFMIVVLRIRPRADSKGEANDIEKSISAEPNMAVASDLESEDGTMRVDVSDIDVGQRTDNISIASGNRSKGRMDVKVGRVKKD